MVSSTSLPVSEARGHPNTRVYLPRYILEEGSFGSVLTMILYLLYVAFSQSLHFVV